MSNLPKEIQQAIEAYSDQYAGSVNNWMGGEKEEYIKFHAKQVAAEWAQKAQPVVDALDELLDLLPSGNLLNHYFAKEQVIKAREELAKYKEVNNMPKQAIEYMPVHPEDARKQGCPKQFPMHLLNADQAYSNHGQSLQRLKERGGLGVIEILAVVNKKPWTFYSKLKWEESLKMLNDILSKEINNE